MRISDWSSDVCSSDLLDPLDALLDRTHLFEIGLEPRAISRPERVPEPLGGGRDGIQDAAVFLAPAAALFRRGAPAEQLIRSDERRVGNGCARSVRSRWSPYH